VLGAGKRYLRAIDEPVGLELVDLKKFATGFGIVVFPIRGLVH
jgi:hypothetical protein